MTTVLVLAALQVPANLTGFYSGLPGLANGAGLSIQMQSHSAIVQLFHQTASTQTLTVFKNNSSKGGTITIAIPNHVRRAGTMGAALGVDLEASWDKANVNPGPPVWTSRQNVNALLNNDGYVTLKVQVKPNATHSLKLSWMGDLMTSGKDGKTRCLAYDVGRASDWAGVGQFKYSIQYQQTDMPNSTEPKGIPVFAVDSTNPSSGWQIGTKGAYLSRLPGVATIFFNYHPNGYGN